MVLEGLHVLYLEDKHVTRFCGLDVEGAGQVVNLAQIDVFDVFGIVGVLDLAAGPVYTFDFHYLVVLDGTDRRD